MTIAFFQFLFGGVFSYIAVRNEDFHQSFKVFLFAVALFLSFNITVVQGAQIGSYGDAYSFVMKVAVLNIPWCLYFVMFFSDKVFLSFQGMILPSSGNYKYDYSKAHSFEIQNKFEEAIEVYKEYISIDPDNYQAYERTARAYYNMNKPVNAVKTLQTVFQLIREAKSNEISKKDINRHEELARLLFLQKMICKKCKIKKHKELSEYLKKNFSNTKFGKEEDFLVQNYFEVWQDIPCPTKV